MSIYDYAISALGKIQEKLAPLPALDQEFAVTEDSLFRKFTLFPYSPDKLIQRKGFKIYEQMITDDAIAQALTALKLMRMASGWDITAASDKPRDKQIRDFVYWNLCDFIEGSVHDDIWEIMGALEMGWSLSELVYTEVESGKYKGKIALKAIKNKRPTEFNIKVDDYDNIVDNGVLKITQPNYGMAYPSDKFVIYSFRKRYEGVFGTSILRSLYDLWWLKHVLKRALGVYAEKFGNPVAVGQYPPTFKPDEQDRLFNVLKQIRFESAITIPKDVEIKFAEASGRGQGHKLFIETIEHINEQITKTILGQTLTSGTSGVGSQALGRVHKDILTMYLEELGHDVATKAINPQIIKRLVDFNFPGVEEYPKWEFNDVAPEDQTPMVDKFITAVKEKVIIPTKDDEAHIREILEFPERDEDSAPMDPPPADPNAPPSAPAPSQEPGAPIAPQSPGPSTTDAASPTIKGATAPAAPVASPAANLTEARRFAEPKFTGVRRRTLTDPEKRVDFAEAVDTIEVVGVDDITLELAPIINEAVDKILRDVQRNKILENQDMRAVNALQIAGVGEMKRVLSDGLIRVARRGERSAKAELTAARKEWKLAEPEDISNFTPDEILKLYKQRAFTMSGTISEQVKAKAQHVLTQGIKNGQPYKEVAEALKEAMEPFVARGLVDGEAVGGARLETIVRTNVVDAYNMARREEFKRDSKFVQYLQYSAILDDRVRPNHAAMDGRVYLTTNSIWDDWTPPAGFSCRCLLIPVTLVDEVHEESDPPPNSVTPDEGFGASGK